MLMFYAYCNLLMYCICIHILVYIRTYVNVITISMVVVLMLFTYTYNVTADKAYREMRAMKMSQSIIVSGQFICVFI